MLQIKHNYICVSSGLRRSFGGSQMLSASKTMREVGCGVIASLDLLLYLCRFHPGCLDCSFFAKAAEDGIIDEKEYDELALALSRRFFPMIPKLGINGILLAGGLNLFFMRYKFPFRASWGIGKGNLFSQIENMLEEDIPVILSIGPNFPLFWQKNQLTFYSRDLNGTLKPSCRINAHYVTVTGIDDELLKISSWGREYYIKRSEYLDYILHHSGSLVSNIVKVRSIRAADNFKENQRKI